MHSPLNVRRWLIRSLCLFAAFSLASCGRGSSPVAPTSTPDPVPPAPVVYSVSGTVSVKDESTPVPGARVEIAEGEGAGRFVVANGDGHYDLVDLKAGTYLIRAEADGFEPASTSLAVSASQVLDFALAAIVEPEEPADPEEPPAPLPDRVSLSGTIFDLETDARLPAARIDVTGGPNAGRRAKSGDDGRYAISDLDPGAIVIVVTLDGYTAVETSKSLEADTEIDVRLERIPEPVGELLSGRVVDVFSTDPVGNVTVTIAGGGETTTAADGTFAVNSGLDETVNRVTFRSRSTVLRETFLPLDAGDQPITLIPGSFDLLSFDQMFRSRGGLQRWVTPPRLVIERRALSFSNTTDMTYVAGDALMTEEEAGELLADLEWTLPQLTGGSIGAFASVEILAAEPGARISIDRDGTILVARFTGLNAAIGAWGYGRWAWNAAGEVQGGLVMLDAVFDATEGPHRRSLRAHELGHALGSDHVSASTSVMHISARIEPTPFDHRAGALAFARPTLNRSPDADPEPTTVSRLRGGLRWSGAR